MIDLLCADISQISELDYARLFEKASPQRQLRANRYRRWEDKVRCVVADALVRHAVKKSLGISDYAVMQDDGGKPYIQGQKNFHFNLSHSGRWVAIAYGDSPVGLDVQQMQIDNIKVQRICRLFAQDEAKYILEAEKQSQIDRFFQVWTAKESYLKYLGTGLCKALNSFSVLNEATHPGVEFFTNLRDGYCMTLCAQCSASDIALINAQELIEKL
jgi:4'-phosphopantetheinyl transferase